MNYTPPERLGKLKRNADLVDWYYKFGFRRLRLDL